MSWAGFAKTVGRGALTIALVAGAVATVPAASAKPTKPNEPTEPLISIGKHRSTFSPNGDGYQDRLRIPFTLRDSVPWIKAQIVDARTGRVVADGFLTRNRGVSDIDWTAGTHYVTWGELHYLPSSDSGRYRERSGPYRLRLQTDRQVGEGAGTARTSFELTTNGVVVARGLAKANDGRGVAFSPNRDGAQDTIAVRYRLERRSRVTAVLRPRYGDAPARRVQLGRLEPGGHRWVWDGRAGRSRVADGGYDLTLVAKPLTGTPRRPSTSTTRINIDTTAPTVRVRLNRSTVYPRATVIADSLRVGVTLDEYATARADIRTLAGKHVDDLTTPSDPCVLESYDAKVCRILTWDGHVGSRPAASGSYLLRTALTDWAGNSTTIPQQVTVSAAQLVEHTGSVTWAGASAPQASDFCMGTHCGEQAPCSEHPSERFAGGVSYRSNPEECEAWQGSAWVDYGFSPDLPAGSTPYDRFWVTASGGPTTMGDDDSARVSILNRGGLNSTAVPVPGPSVKLTGDTTATTDWAPVRPDVELFEGIPRIRWGAGTERPQRYDIASFTVKYTYYAPAG